MATEKVLHCGIRFDRWIARLCFHIIAIAGIEHFLSQRSRSLTIAGSLENVSIKPGVHILAGIATIAKKKLRDQNDCMDIL